MLLVGPHRHRVVARVAEEVVRRADVAPALADVDAVGHLVDDHVVAHEQVAAGAVEPDPDLGVLDVEALDHRAAERAADPVDLVRVDALGDLADDREVGEAHVVGAAVLGPLAVEADGVGPRRLARRALRVRVRVLERGGRPGHDRVPVARADDVHVVDDDVPRHLEGALGDPHDGGALATALGERDRLVERLGRVAPPGRVGAEAGDRHRGGRPLRGLGDPLVVEQVDHGPVGLAPAGTVSRSLSPAR